MDANNSVRRARGVDAFRSPSGPLPTVCARVAWRSNADAPGAIPNRVPQIRTREIESVLRLAHGEIGVLGGLMEDKLDYDTGRIPLLGAIPVVGELFTRRENVARRTELVIFLRPVIINEASVAGDYKNFRAQLPVADFFDKDFTPPRYQLLPSASGDRQ